MLAEPTKEIATDLDELSLIALKTKQASKRTTARKKFDDIPVERRHRLLHLLKPRLILKAWEIAGTRYENPKLAKKSASNLFSSEDGVMPLEFYDCQTSGGGSVLARLASSYSPLYFMVRQISEVTQQNNLVI